MTESGSRKLLTVIVLAIPVLFLLFNPGQLWAVHHLMYLNSAAIVLLLVLALSIIWFPALRHKPFIFLESINSVWLLFILALLWIWFFPTNSLAYGDSRNIIKIFNNPNDDSTGQLLLKIFSPDIFRLHNGEFFNLNIARLFHRFFKTGASDTFRYLGLIWGGSTVLIWLVFLKKYHPKLTIFGFLLLLSSLSFQNFNGHAEIYASTVFFLSLTVLAASISIKSKNKYWLVLVIVGAFFSIKSHFINWIIVLLVIQVVLFQFSSKSKMAKKLLGLRTQIFILLPIGLVIFLIIYFLVFNAQSSAYYNHESSISENVFLPIVPNEIPYHRYHLFSIYHITDWINTIIGWGVLPLIIALLFFRKIPFQIPLGLSMLLLPIFAYALLFFFFNPVLGMARDWDLFSIAGPLIILAVILMMSHFNSNGTLFKLFIISWSIIILPRAIVENSSDMQSKRLLDIGQFLHKTYYAGSIVPLTQGLENYTDLNDEWFAKHSQRLIENGIEGKDIMLGHYFLQVGLKFQDYNPGKAASYFDESLVFAPGYEPSVRNGAIAHMNSGNFQKGLEYAEFLLSHKSSSEILKIAINCALKLENEQYKVTEFAQQLLIIEPENKTAQALLGQ